MKKLLPIITCLTLVFLSACSSINNSNNTNEDITVRVSSDYAVYSDVESLSEHSDSVIEGVVINSRVEEIDTTVYFVDGVPIHEIEDERINPRYIPGEEKPEPPEPSIEPYTVFTVKVKEVYNGNINKNELIDVAFLGGKSSGSMWISEDDVLLDKNNTYVLFLKTNPEFPYAVLTNPLQSSYEVNVISDDNETNKGDIKKEIKKLHKENPFDLDFSKLEKIKKNPESK